MEGRNENKKGLWTEEEDRILMNYVRLYGIGKWNSIAKATGLKRCGKSCRLRWMNHLTPNIKRDNFSEEEDDLIIRLHNLLGNRWSLIAGRVPGRTDNQVKNHWNTRLSKKMGIKKSRKNFSPRIQYRDSMEKIPMNSNLPSSFKGGIASQHVLEEVKDGFENSSLFANDDLSFHDPNFMDFLKENFLDFDWYGL